MIASTFFGTSLYLIDRAVIGQPEFEDNASFLQALVVLDGVVDHVGVGHHDLLATQAADPCGLEAHVLDRAGQRADDDEVADLERLVYCDGQRGKHVAQNVLHRQRDRDTADPRLATNAVILTPTFDSIAMTTVAHSNAFAPHRLNVASALP